MITSEEFVMAWQAAKSAKEAAEKLGISVQHASARAAGYRRKGICMKMMAGRRPRLDIKALNRLAKESLKDG